MTDCKSTVLNFGMQPRCFDYLKNKHGGIIFLQETFSSKEDEKKWAQEWNGNVYMSHGTKHSKGVAILMPKCEYDIRKVLIDTEGRYILLDLNLEGTDLTLLNYYAPTKSNQVEQTQYLDKLVPLVTEYHENLIWAGDFNVNINPKIDKKGGRQEKESNYAKKLINIMEELNLIDIGRTINPEVQRYTWRENTPHGIIQSRLDMFICPNNLIYNVKKCNIENSVYSDHNPITLSLYTNSESVRGKGTWKFNNSLLSDLEYIDKVKGIILECKKKYSEENNHSLIWDTVKTEIRGMTISHSTYISRLRKKQIQTLSKELETLDQILSNNPNDDNHQAYITTKKELEHLNNHITRGIMLRANVKYMELNEANNKFFLSRRLKQRT